MLKMICVATLIYVSFKLFGVGAYELQLGNKVLGHAVALLISYNILTVRGIMTGNFLGGKQ